MSNSFLPDLDWSKEGILKRHMEALADKRAMARHMASLADMAYFHSNGWGSKEVAVTKLSGGIPELGNSEAVWGHLIHVGLIRETMRQCLLRAIHKERLKRVPGEDCSDWRDFPLAELPYSHIKKITVKRIKKPSIGFTEQGLWRSLEYARGGTLLDIERGWDTNVSEYLH